MRNRFDQKLETLNEELIRMGALCQEGLQCAVQSIFEEDEEAMAVHIAGAGEAEAQIDQLERDIEAMCMRLLLQHHPVARDLRIIGAALKMISDLERIGDQAQDIAEIAKHLAKTEIPNPLHLQDMAEFAADMVAASIAAFVEQDADAARRVILADDVVDRCFEQVKEDLIEDIGKGTRDGHFLLDILMIAKYIERIGDHATNVAEWVVYGLTGAHPEESN